MLVAFLKDSCGRFTGILHFLVPMFFLESVVCSLSLLAKEKLNYNFDCCDYPFLANVCKSKQEKRKGNKTSAEMR